MSRRQGRGQDYFLWLGSLTSLLFALACGSDAELVVSTRSGVDAGVAERPALQAEPAGETDAGEPPVVDDTVARVAEALPVEWTPCSLYTGQRLDERPFEEQAAEGDAGAPTLPPVPKARCATFHLPLYWDEPEGPTFAWFVKKVPAEGESRGQLWLLQGGPGGPGVGLEQLAEDLHRELPDLDLYVPDHRGVGRSTLFDCDAAFRGGGTPQGQLATCGQELRAEWREATQAFTTTHASRDVLAVATRLHRRNDEVIVWGGSYGGYWAHRLLQIDGTGLFTAAVFDSAALPTGGRSTLQQTLEVTEAGDALFDACADDRECSERLGPDPKARALEILDDLCEPFQDRGGRQGVQGLVTEGLRRWGSLRLIPAILYRAERCSEADVAYLDGYARQLTPSTLGGTEEAPESTAILFHITFSEIVTEMSDHEEIVAASELEVFSSGFPFDLEAALADWPRYPLDEFTGKWAETDIPVLIVHGALDTQTPPSHGFALAERYTAGSQQFFFLPTGTHGIYSHSHSITGDESTSCGKHLTVQFLRSPTTPVDGSCVDEAPKLDFAASEERLLEIAGHTDVWDNPEE